jgi:hypothetical protein
MSKTTETIEWLETEVKQREDILADSFMRSNLEGIELSLMAVELEIYKNVLTKLK